ncbi:O-antigen ligase family protein [Pelagibacteraceae bacterium]|nr:O-antigen ligase family protein [Pelagibacteraceae bacterium]
MIAFIISKIVNDEDHTLKYISFIFLLCSILLSLDIIYQSQTGFDIFGYQAGLCTFPDGEQNLNPLNCERFSGFFGDELIAGNFLVTYGLFFSYIFFTRLKKNFFNILLFSLSTLLIFLAIIISGERNAFLSILLILLFNILFNKKARTYLIYPILIFLLIFTFSFKKFEHIKYRYIDWPISSVTSSEGNIFKKLIQTPWGAHYVTSYEIFSNNKIFGSGFKSFREECKKDIYSLENINKKYDLNIPYSGCSTHPHNMHIELLTEAGSVGFVLFFILIFFIIFKPYFKNINYIKDKQDVIFVLSIIFSIMFPFRPTGSFSGTISASNLWFFIGFYLYFINNLKLKK